MAKHGENGTKKRAQQILAATEALLLEGGYEGISARDIAREAGVNKALVFYYWGSMEALLERVIERYYERHRKALARAVDGDGTLAQRVHRLIDAYIDFIEDNRLYPRLVQQQVAGGGSQQALVHKHLSQFFRWTTDLMAGLTPSDGPLSARHFYLSLSGVVVNYFTYTPVIGELWGDDPMSEAALAERRQHVHWLVDTLITRLEKEATNTA